MKEFKNKNRIPIILFISISIVMGLLTLVDQKEVLALLATPFPTFPTEYPPLKQTIEWKDMLTREADRELTALPPGNYFLPPTPTTMPTRALRGTPAGAGIITNDFGLPPGNIRAQYAIENNLGWVEFTDYGVIIVYVGSLRDDTLQGLVYVVRSNNGVPSGRVYLTPTKSGSLSMVAAQGEKLILRSTNSTNFYFDVASEKYLSALSETPPTVIPFPTRTIEPTNTLTYKDDAPDKPGFVSQNSLANKDLRFFINPLNDEDWFRFHSPTIGTIEVELDDLPANYDLYVYSASYSQVSGKSTKNGREDEKVVLRDAPVDDYYVRVVGVDGAWSATKPYTLKFKTESMPTKEPTRTATTTPTVTPTRTVTPIRSLTPTPTPTQYPITIQGLRQMLRDLNQRDQVNDGLYRALDVILISASRQVAYDNERVAMIELRVFIRIVEAQSGKQIKPEAAEQLITHARKVIERLYDDDDHRREDD